MVKFFGKQEYTELDYDTLDSTITLRTATNGVGYHKKNITASFEDMADMLTNTSISYNEVVGFNNKLFFDIDDCKNALNFKKCLKLIERQICRF